LKAGAFQAAFNCCIQLHSTAFDCIQLVQPPHLGLVRRDLRRARRGGDARGELALLLPLLDQRLLGVVVVGLRGHYLRETHLFGE
jgi:hypothetical protein